MKFNLKTLSVLLFFTFVIMPAAAFAITQEIPDVSDPNVIVLLLSPALTWLAVEAAKKLKALITKSGIAAGWILGFIVPILSAVIAWLLSLVAPDSSFLTLLLIGLGSTFVDNVIKLFKTE